MLVITKGLAKRFEEKGDNKEGAYKGK